MDMKGKPLFAAAFSVLVLAIDGTTWADAKSITLPTEAPSLKPSTLPGYAKAQTHCVACHSAEYMLYQPPTAPRAYWEAMVTRMKVVFKAPIDDADMPEIVDYLVKTYGNEQPR
jgi:sulfite dehydrogenase (cytochrome) subunit B